jgi:hypothetical protein
VAKGGVHTKLESDAELRTYVMLVASNAGYWSLHPLVVLMSKCCGVAVRPNLNIANLRGDSPLVGGFVPEVRVHAINGDRMLERVIASAKDMAHTKHWCRK